MNKRRAIALLGLAALVVAGVATYALRPREPVYQGRRLSEWLEDLGTGPVVIGKGGPILMPLPGMAVANNQKGLLLLNSLAFDPEPDPRQRRAKRAVLFMGSNAIPWLLAEVQARSSPLKLKFIALLSKQSLMTFRFTTDAERRQRAIRALGALGHEAASAVPILLELYETHPEYRPAVSEALGKTLKERSKPTAALPPGR